VSPQNEARLDHLINQLLPVWLQRSSLLVFVLGIALAIYSPRFFNSVFLILFLCLIPVMEFFLWWNIRQGIRRRHLVTVWFNRANALREIDDPVLFKGTLAGYWFLAFCFPAFAAFIIWDLLAP